MERNDEASYDLFDRTIHLRPNIRTKTDWHSYSKIKREKSDAAR
jgi:hypothetical protein